MRRVRLFEFEDLSWFPKSIRDAGADYLRLMWELGAYKPVVPLYVGWDGFDSGLRLYSVRDLHELVTRLPSNDYLWEVGGDKFPRCISYVIGYPKQAVDR